MPAELTDESVKVDIFRTAYREFTEALSEQSDVSYKVGFPRARLSEARIKVYYKRLERLMESFLAEPSDPHGKVLNGHFRYFDESGTLRAEGDYVNGQKFGTWTRFDDRGASLPAKEYDGLDWDAKQIKLGLASLSASLGDVVVK